VEPQQLAAKVTQLEARVATLEDENKIVRGEVKQILTEIRTAVLVRDNPFDAGDGGRPAPPVTVVASAPAPVTKLELVMPERATEDAPPPAAPAAAHAASAASQPPRAAEPTPLPIRQPVADTTPVARPAWSLLTIAGLSAWSEEAVRRIGPLRLEILLDLCEAAGHLSTDARAALSRITELDLPEPSALPSTNETASLLRQLEALVGDGDDHGRNEQRSSRRL
jgi:hypothetical protein